MSQPTSNDSRKPSDRDPEPDDLGKLGNSNEDNYKRDIARTHPTVEKEKKSDQSSGAVLRDDLAEPVGPGSQD